MAPARLHDTCPLPVAQASNITKKSKSSGIQFTEAKKINNSLLVLGQCLSVVSHPPLLSCLTKMLLHPRLDLADIKLSKLDVLTNPALERARNSLALSLDRASTEVLYVHNLPVCPLHSVSGRPASRPDR